MRVLFVLALIAGLTVQTVQTVQAEERISVCFNYGCYSREVVVYSDDQLRTLGLMLKQADNAEQEREAIARAVGQMLAWAGEQTPISADRGGNYADDGVRGRMDCIDHSTTSTQLLQLIERHGWLRYHRVLDIVQRKRFLLFDHFAAQIGEVDTRSGYSAPGSDGAASDQGIHARYAVDSWFFDNGHPATVMPLERWLAGESPDVSDK